MSPGVSSRQGRTCRSEAINRCIGITTIFTSDEFRSETIHLIEDVSTADRLVVRSEIEYSRAVMSVELYEPKTKQSVIVSVRLPLDVISPFRR